MRLDPDEMQETARPRLTILEQLFALKNSEAKKCASSVIYRSMAIRNEKNKQISIETME